MRNAHFISYQEFLYAYCLEHLKDRPKQIVEYNRILRHDNSAPLTGRIHGYATNLDLDLEETSSREVFRNISRLFGD